MRESEPEDQIQYGEEDSPERYLKHDGMATPSQRQYTPVPYQQEEDDDNFYGTMYEKKNEYDPSDMGAQLIEASPDIERDDFGQITSETQTEDEHEFEPEYQM